VAVFFSFAKNLMLVRCSIFVCQSFFWRGAKTLLHTRTSDSTLSERVATRFCTQVQGQYPCMRFGAAGSSSAAANAVSLFYSRTSYTILVPAHLLRNWREQWPSNKSDLVSSITGKVGRVHYAGVDLILISFLYRSTWLLLGCVLNGALCT
jgi:hypothetical protein